MLKPICIKCHLFFRPKKNGFYFTEGKPLPSARPGLRDAAMWLKYKLWSGDLWECRGCGAQIIVSVEMAPIVLADVVVALKLPLLFHGGGIWDDEKRAEWLRITGTTEATTKVMCEHLRSVLEMLEP